MFGPKISKLKVIEIEKLQASFFSKPTTKNFREYPNLSAEISCKEKNNEKIKFIKVKMILFCCNF